MFGLSFCQKAPNRFSTKWEGAYDSFADALDAATTFAAGSHETGIAFYSVSERGVRKLSVPLWLNR
jgi:hypothetical protein